MTITEIKGWKRFALAWLVTLVALGLSGGAGFGIMALLGIPLPNENADGLLEALKSTKPSTLALVIGLTTLGEEVVFRALPMLVAWGTCRWLKAPRGPTILLLACVSCAAFARAHGAWGNLAVQGVEGAVLFVFFLKAGAISNRLFKATLATWSVHLAFDAILMSLALVGISMGAV